MISTLPDGTCDYKTTKDEDYQIVRLTRSEYERSDEGGHLPVCYSFTDATQGNKRDISEEWSVNGWHHRRHGPAFIWADGHHMWYIRGDRYKDPKSFQKAADLTDLEFMLILLKYDFKTVD